MNDVKPEPIAVVGVSAIMPDAPDGTTFWANIRDGRYSISDVPGDRWDPELYYDPDPHAPYKTYSRIGGWVREFDWDPLAWKLPVPPAVGSQLDDGQKWAIAAARTALLDAGWPKWTVDPERVAVVIGNAIGGEKHYDTNLHIEFPTFVRSLRDAPSFAGLPDRVRSAVLEEARESFFAGFPGVTEDTMPGELANVIAGRVANLFNFRGPNFTTDAACASGLAATYAAVRGLQAHDVDAAVTGGVDRNMGVAAFVKFCKIGALSATGTRPFDADADGFVMGEGAALFVLKRLADAERAGDRIYAVVAGHRGLQRRPRQGNHRPEPDRAAPGRAAGVGQRRPHPGVSVLRRGTWHLHPRRRRHGAGQSHRGVRQGGRCAGIDGTRLRQVQHRPPQGCGGHSRTLQDGHESSRPGACAEPQLRPPQPERGLGRDPVPGQHVIARVAGALARRCPVGWGQRLRLRWHQLPRRTGGVRAGAVQERGGGTFVRRPTVRAPAIHCGPCLGGRTAEGATARSRGRGRTRRGRRSRAARPHTGRGAGRTRARAGRA